MRKQGLLQHPNGGPIRMSGDDSALDEGHLTLDHVVAVAEAAACSRHEPGVFAPVLDTPRSHGDHCRHPADRASYGATHQRPGELYADQETWPRRAILNIAGSGKLPSDRTIAGYALDTWQVQACPVT